eukprot:Sspe_Gene.79859::Locus_50184_Transcript_1_1_Confidence_1.000_Length_2574::g.79859::m.79859/K02541/MCM3; DNA replication licensing factor MCM3
MASGLLTESQQAVKQLCRDFFDKDREGSRKYQQKIDALVRANGRRLVIDIQDLHGYSLGDETAGDLGQQILRSPQEYLRFFDEAFREVVENSDTLYAKANIDIHTLRVGLDGYFGKLQLTPRQLTAWHLNRLVALEGVITRMSTNIAKIKRSVHFNSTKNTFTERSYRDQLAPDVDDNHLPTVNVMPKRDVEGNLLRTEHGLCIYEDMQHIIVQEMPEKAPVGHLPRSVDVRLEMDLVDSCKPGDRVRVVGIFMPFTENNKDFSTILIANNVVLLNAKEKEPDISPEDEEMIKKMAQKPDIFDQLASAVAPSIFGHDQAKKAIILMMLGGVEHDVDDHHHIRGDIHVLLVGEPATAKSQLLRFVLSLAPLALSTTGKGSSGVGLTGAVTMDPDTGEKTLAAGAMVLADRGVLCIDEFDKMGDNDRVAMHEAMEQGTVTIAKAGIHATLNARCSVIAAANPIYGFYAVKHSVAFNLSLPESLLSRFDLLFIILDDKTSEWTRLVADHVLQNHRTGEGITIGSEGARDSSITAGRNSSIQQKGLQVYHTTNPYRKRIGGKKLITVDFLRAYLRYAKHMKPVLTDTARDKVEEYWLALRQEQADQTNRDQSAIYINPRTLESLIRLSTAHAKCRLSSYVEEADVDVAIDLVKNTVNARSTAMETREREKRQMRERMKEKDEETRGATEAEEVAELQRVLSVDDPDALQPLLSSSTEAPSGTPAAPPSEPPQKKPKLVSKRDTQLQEAQRALLRVINVTFTSEGVDVVDPASLRDDLNAALSRAGWTEDDEVETTEFNQLLQKLEANEDIMIDEDGGIRKV